MLINLFRRSLIFLFFKPWNTINVYCIPCLNIQFVVIVQLFHCIILVVLDRYNQISRYSIVFLQYFLQYKCPYIQLFFSILSDKMISNSTTCLLNFRIFQTSAPSIVHVDEFHEELSMAEQKKREAERLRLQAAPNKQRFFMDLNKKVNQFLHFT